MYTDFRYAFRILLKNPGFTTVAVLTLALGLGACTAMFSLVYAVLLRPLPFRDPGRLVWIENIGTDGMSARTTRVDNFLDWRARTESFEKLGAYFAFFDYSRYTLTDNGEPQRLRGVPISQNLLEVLGVQPILGRQFVDEECVWNGRKAAILSHAFWKQRFAGDRNVVGRSVTLNGDPTEIVGVMPPSFDFDSVFAPGTEIDLLLPFPLVEQTARWGNTLFAVGRLKPSTTIAQARAEFDVISRVVANARPERGTFGARMAGLDASIRGSFRTALLILSGAVGCVLLIGCVNLSNLLLARANARRKEFAVRVALGAGRWRLVRQTLIESLVLALGGCALGVPIAYFVTAALTRLHTFGIPLLQTTTVDSTVLAFTAVLSCLAGALCGILPALQLLRVNEQKTLTETGQRGSAGKHSALIRKSLVIAEVALACVLLVGAGLLVRSFVELLEVDLGFQPKRAVAWRVDPIRSFKSAEDWAQYYDGLVERVLAVPGIESAGLSDTLPLGRNRDWGIGAKGVTYTRENYPVAFPRIVDHRYLQTMHIPLRAGRYFDERDNSTTDKVIVINETLAKHLWPGRDAIGQIAVINRKDWRVVGIVGDVRHGTLEAVAGAEMYLNFRQIGDWNAIELVVRTSRLPESFVSDVRAAMKAFDPALPNSEFTTLDQIVDDAVAPRRLITHLLGAFSSFALALASLGLYGVIAYSVSQRTQDIGIRLAIGAQRGDVLRLVVGEGFRMAAAGVAVGVIAALVLSRLLASLLFGVTPTDPLILSISATVVTSVALLACYIPARRAAKVDPVVALRCE
jgi:predicted permease